VDQQTWPGPFDLAGIIPDFDLVATLGKKGTRAMDRVTGIAVATVGMLLAGHREWLAANQRGVGLVLGTCSGSVQSIMDFTTDSLVNEKPFHVDPARFPNTVMNCAAGQSAIWHGLKGPNTTIAGGALTGLLALNYAMRLCRGGRCAAVLCGAVEEYSTQRGWLEWHGRSAATGPLGEGCALFLLEPRSGAAKAGRSALATVLGARFAAFSTAADARPALARCVGEVLKLADAGAGAVRMVATSDADGELGASEDAAIAESLGEGEPDWLRCRPLIGDLSAASAAFQLAAVLAAAEHLPAGQEELALVTSVDPDGTAGCVLLRVSGGRTP
jgi:3-oxoacyl-[acyl-carrier-protein] synthase II